MNEAASTIDPVVLAIKEQLRRFAMKQVSDLDAAEAIRALVRQEIRDRHGVATRAVDLGAIEARVNAASRGAWRCVHQETTEPGHDGLRKMMFSEGPGGGHIATVQYAGTADDWHFIAHAPEDVKQLVAAVREGCVVDAAPIQIHCERCSTRDRAVAHCVNREQAERIIYTLQGMLIDQAGDAECATRKATEHCPLMVLAWSVDSEMYAEYCDSAVEARGVERSDDYMDRIYAHTSRRHVTASPRHTHDEPAQTGT